MTDIKDETEKNVSYLLGDIFRELSQLMEKESILAIQALQRPEPMPDENTESEGEDGSLGNPGDGRAEGAPALGSQGGDDAPDETEST